MPVESFGCFGGKIIGFYKDHTLAVKIPDQHTISSGEEALETDQPLVLKVTLHQMQNETFPKAMVWKCGHLFFNTGNNEFFHCLLKM